MDGLGWNWARVAEMWSRALGSDSGASQGFMFQSNTTSALINQLRFAAAKSNRTSLIILASFNALAAAATAFGIFWDCYTGAKRNDPRFRLRSSLLSVIGPKETFPFVLSCAIVIQSIIFAVVQSKGLKSLLILGCTPVSQLMLPALFIVPYIQLVFGLETALRAVRRYPFPERPKWTVPICLGIITAGLIGTYVLTRFVVPPNFCFAGLLRLVQRWSLGCFALLTAIASSLLIASLITITRLYRTSGIFETHRTCASWMACYMALAVVTMAVMIPSLWNLSLARSGKPDRQRRQLLMAANVAMNLSGLTTGGLYILLRSTRLGRIGPRGHAEFDSQISKTGKRPSLPMYAKQMEQPVSPVRLHWIKMSTDRIDETRNEEEKVESRPGAPTGGAPGPLSSKAVQSSPPKAPAAAHMPAATTRRPSIRKDSYNIFPPKQEAPDVKPMYLLPAATYNPSTKTNAPSESPFDLLLPPPTIRTSRHLRNSSLGSSATVQIGLRVSNLNDMPPVTSYYQAPYPRNSEYPRNFGLAISTDVEPSALDGTQGIDLQNADKVSEGTTEKQLPPVPLSTAKDTKNDEDETTLSPSVYSPQAQSPIGSGRANKTASPRGSPTRPPPPGPSWSFEGLPRVRSVEWI
ncbi:Uncharacterized protein TPAR_04567 [Tolypocladium paradoxum]|uniref:Uncharacterized protein n=1 Tax=Tolypocladium paradoxum TaxID=94208 RepID=A0A2S4KYG0_9HYPO|nr:Uncharacterized protein TPAR_04567 [Tolypocladium paradoxum]